MLVAKVQRSCSEIPRYSWLVNGSEAPVLFSLLVATPPSTPTEVKTGAPAWSIDCAGPSGPVPFVEAGGNYIDQTSILTYQPSRRPLLVPRPLGFIFDYLMQLPRFWYVAARITSCMANIGLVLGRLLFRSRCHVISALNQLIFPDLFVLDRESRSPLYWVAR